MPSVTGSKGGLDLLVSIQTPAELVARLYGAAVEGQAIGDTLESLIRDNGR